MARIEPITVKRRLAECPVCHYPLFAEVDIAVEVGSPDFDGEGKVRCHVRPVPAAMRLNHECRKGED